MKDKGDLLLNSTADHPMNECRDAVEFFISDETSRPHVQAIFGIFYSLIFVIGLLGNGLVIASVWRYPSLQTVRNFFIVSLSCSDIVVCLTSLPITPVTLIKKNWMFGSFLCYAFPLFQGMSICISTFTLMGVAVDRYILIVFPTIRPIQQTQAAVMIVGIWAMAALVCLPMVVHYQYYYGPDQYEHTHTIISDTNWTTTIDHQFTTIDTRTTTITTDFITHEPAPVIYCGYFCDEQWPSQRVQKIYGTFVLILQFLVPLIVIAFCYAHICLRLGRSAKMKRLTKVNKFTYSAHTLGIAGGSSAITAAEARQQAVLRKKRRTNRMLIAMVVVFACSWCPQVTMNLLRDLSLDWLQSYIDGHIYFYSLLCHAIAMTSTVWNPLLYSFMNTAFRSAFAELMPCLGGIQRTMSGRRSEPRTRYPLSQPGIDSATVGHSGNAGGKPRHLLPVSMASDDSLLKNDSHRRIPLPVDGTLTETSALLPDNTNQSIRTKSICPSNGVDVTNGELPSDHL